MADSTKRAQLLRGLLATTTSNSLIEGLSSSGSIESSNSFVDGVASFRQRLINAQESGQPIPRVRLSNGDELNNVVVTDIDVDAVAFTDPSTDNTAIVRIEEIVSFGTL
ncbi:hypothetical protein AB0764_27230 (plasmid) [Priestia megaterium]|uniref:hypothetical protein n=1 Tax=Priestia megaterium TaxID=1404 RepID=UPI0015FE1629